MEYNIDKSMSFKDKIIKAKVLLQKDSPFFSYLVSRLNIIEADIGNHPIGVDIKGNVMYNSEKFEELTSGKIELVQSVLMHEVMHVCLMHLKRKVEHQAHPEFWNIATDMVVNLLILKNGYKLPKGVIPNKNTDSMDILGIRINNISNKTAETIYNELVRELKNEPKGNSIGFDEHKQGDNSENEQGKDKKDDKNQLIESKEQQKEIDGNQLLMDAFTFAQNKGVTPKGLDRYVDELVNPKVDYKSLLQRAILNELFSDYSYSRPSKKTMATGIYLPSVKKEKLDIVVTVDTSGSIDETQLKEALTEVASISLSFDNVSITLLHGDSTVQGSFELNNESIDKIKSLKLKGGGGTDHRPFYSWIEANKPETRLVVNFSDGQTTFPEEESIPTIWVLSEDTKVPFGERILIN